MFDNRFYHDLVNGHSDIAFRALHRAEWDPTDQDEALAIFDRISTQVAELESVTGFVDLYQDITDHTAWLVDELTAMSDYIAERFEGTGGVI